MQIDYVLVVNIIGLVLILVIIGWFWLSKPRVIKKTGNLIEIKVKNGVYKPDNIEVPLNQTIMLRFVREDPSGCAEMVIFNQLGISQKLLLKTPIDIPLTLKAPGEYDFTCQMGMYRGKLIVKKSS